MFGLAGASDYGYPFKLQSCHVSDPAAGSLSIITVIICGRKKIMCAGQA